MYCTKRCLIRIQKGVSNLPKGHLLQAYWAFFRSEKSINSKGICEKLGQNRVRLNLSLHEEWIVLPYLLSLLNGSSGFWSDNVCYLRLGFWGNSHTEKRRGRRIIKTKQWKSRRHRWCTERRSLFANFISNLYTKRLSQSIYQEFVCYTSVALCAVGSSVTLRLPPSPPWLRVPII